MPAPNNLYPALIDAERAIVEDKYRLGEMIGSGGIGTVYRAKHIWTEREVAIKVLDPSLPSFDDLKEAFLQEARATVRLAHPNVVEVLDMGEVDDQTIYMVMELLDGPTLRDILHERGSLSADDTFSVLWPLMDALEKAHELGIVHCDFKPENIILSRDANGVMTPKLLDFGVAQLVHDSRFGLGDSDETVVSGTPQYMSPEQAHHQKTRIGPHTDVWGVCVVWYECVTGRPLFDGDTPLDVLRNVCEQPIDFDDLPQRHAAVLRDGLVRLTEDRIQRIGELKARVVEAGIVPASNSLDRARSSWPAPVSKNQVIHQTLHGLGPESAKLLAPSAAYSGEEAPMTLVRKSPVAVLLAGVGLMIAVALAAWSTVHEPDVSTDVRVAPSSATRATPPDEPAVTARSELPAKAEPLPNQAASSPVEPQEVEVDSTEELQRDAVFEAEALPIDPAGAEAEPEAVPVEATPAKAEPTTDAKDGSTRRRPKATRRSPRHGSKNKSTDSLPGLVTEW